MTYAITGLAVEPFRPFFGLPDEDLARHHIVRMTATAAVGFPCRVLLEDARPGDTLLLLNHEYQPIESPYQGRHAIFVNEAADAPRTFVDEIPAIFSVRPFISLRAFDEAGMMVDAEIASGDALEPVIARMFEIPEVAYLHAHNTGRGCYAARIDRA